MREIDIKFNVPPYVDKAADYIQECVKNQKICGDGEYTKKCNAWRRPPAPMRQNWQHFCVTFSPGTK